MVSLPSEIDLQVPCCPYRLLPTHSLGIIQGSEGTALLVSLIQEVPRYLFMKGTLTYNAMFKNSFCVRITIKEDTYIAIKTWFYEGLE